MALNCRINGASILRKRIFYPRAGLPVSQYDKPLAERGAIEIKINGSTKRIGIHAYIWRRCGRPAGS
jgi:aspartyl-tRNA(Asn)/glutamyl-tRNA(Gln) amidotransferase subunit B